MASPGPAHLSSDGHRSFEIETATCTLHADEWVGGGDSQVLLLHGLGGNAITWHGVAPTLATELGARVVAIDLPGFGASRPGTASTGVVDLAKLALEVMQRSGRTDEPWHLAGNSLGGLLALYIAAVSPSACRSVTLAALALPLSWGRKVQELASLFQFVPAAVPYLGRYLFLRYVQRRGLPGVVDDPVAALFHDPTVLPSDLRDRLLEVSAYRLGWPREAARAYEHATRSLGLELLRQSEVRRWMANARCPVLSVYGTRDPLYPPGAWDELRRKHPAWQHVALHDVGHVPQLEAPERFVRRMLEFVRSAEG